MSKKRIKKPNPKDQIKSKVDKARAELSKENNPRFDEERFIFACQREVK